MRWGRGVGGFWSHEKPQGRSGTGPAWALQALAQERQQPSKSEARAHIALCNSISAAVSSQVLIVRIASPFTHSLNVSHRHRLPLAKQIRCATQKAGRNAHRTNRPPFLSMGSASFWSVELHA